MTAQGHQKPGGADPLAPRGARLGAAGFWVAARDAGHTLGDLVAQGWGLSAGCARCGHARVWRPGQLAAAPRLLRVGEVAARLVCGQPACASVLGTLAVLRPRDRRRRHLSARDLARIRAMAEQVTPERQPPILDDLDAPIRVGACLPGQETYLGAQVIAAWRGRLLLGWPLPRKARSRRRALDGRLG